MFDWSVAYVSSSFVSRRSAPTYRDDKELELLLLLRNRKDSSLLHCSIEEKRWNLENILSENSSKASALE